MSMILAISVSVLTVYTGISLIVSAIVTAFLIAMFGEAVHAGHARWDRHTWFTIGGQSLKNGFGWPLLIFRNVTKSG